MTPEVWIDNDGELEVLCFNNSTDTFELHNEDVEVGLIFKTLSDCHAWFNFVGLQFLGEL